MFSPRNKLAARTAVTVAGVLFTLFCATPARAQTPVTFGSTINAPGVYFLAGNQSGAGNGILIASDDVTLLLSRFTLRGNGTGYGVHVEARRRVTIVGGRITNFVQGVEIINSADCSIKDTRIDHSRSNGLLLHRDARTEVLRVRTEHNAANGVRLTSGQDIRLTSVLSNNNGGDGVHSDAFGPIGTRNSKFKNCWFAYNSGNGMQMLNAGLNDVRENQFVQNQGAGLLLGGTATEMLVGADGSDDNVITRNWCVFNVRAGIALLLGSDLNDLSLNTALANRVADLVDENPEPPCANTWFLNSFFRRDGDGEDCIF